VGDASTDSGSPRHEALKSFLITSRQSDEREVEHRWSQKVVPEALEHLREHPVFSPGDSAEEAILKGGAGALTGQLRQEDREPLYVAELLRIFRSRIRLVSTLGLVLVPIFSAFYFYLSPHVSNQIIWVNALMMVALLACNLLATTIKTLAPMRALALTGYLAFCSGAAWVVSIVTHSINLNNLSGSDSHNVQFVVLGSFIHILLSILLLPFTLLEATLAALIALSCMAWGLAISVPFESNTSYLSQLFVISTTAVLILTISHLSGVLRRNAFHAAFDLALQAARMREMSATDLLTGGYNRRYIENLLSLEIARAGRFAHSLSLLMFDLDNFKPVNDSLGHSAGDEVLRQIWQASMVALREVDTLARFGGDEFLIVLPETGSIAARNISERLRTVVSNQLREKWGPDSLEGRVTLSIGLLTIEGRDFVAVDHALAKVDELLYEAKRGGKNRTAVG
jgi:diguanylate cyclase (GGDEF)-like protein